MMVSEINSFVSWFDNEYQKCESYEEPFEGLAFGKDVFNYFNKNKEITEAFFKGCKGKSLKELKEEFELVKRNI